jgi:tetratricopeptide (TPR) repeat protein
LAAVDQGVIVATAAYDTWVTDRSASGVREFWVEALGLAQAAADQNRHLEALELLRELRSPGGPTDLIFQAALIESWSNMVLGRLGEALSLAQRANDMVAHSDFTDLDRADVLFRLGCCRLKRTEFSLAASLFTVALELCDRSDLTCDRLRASILHWRSRCYQHQRDWNAARHDVNCSIELAVAIGDNSTLAHAQFQASAVAERTGDLRLARYHAEEAEALFRDLDDRLMLGRTTNNLGGIVFLQGDTTGALRYLDDAMQIALADGNEADAAQAISSVAQIHLRSGQPDLAESKARNALEILGDREDFLDEIGNAELVLARALLAQTRYEEAEAALSGADRHFQQLGSVSQRAAVCMARGEVMLAQGACLQAAETYRSAAEALQDFHF